MKSKSSDRIKESFESYSKKQGFNFHESDPMIAPNDSKLLFNISGGVKYQKELLGLVESDEKRVSSIQKCIRTDGMKSVGLTGRHHIFFEMLGHFMFYCKNEKDCKDEFIKFAYYYLIKELGMDKKRVFATVHPLDEATIIAWKKLGNNNLIETDKNTFVSPYADKSALRTEILWQKDDNSLVELWNLVFTQFNSKEVFTCTSDKIAADSGASLERITSAIENKSNNYENSMWADFIEKIINISQEKRDVNIYRRIADFANSSIMLIDEGILPGSKIQPYMLRKILRNLFDMCDDAKIDIKELMLILLNYNLINITDEYLLNIVLGERNVYLKTIENGLKQAKRMIDKEGINHLDKNYLKSTCGLSEYYINQLFSQDTSRILKRKLK